jgi:hypothetical protein
MKNIDIACNQQSLNVHKACNDLSLMLVLELSVLAIRLELGTAVALG